MMREIRYAVIDMTDCTVKTVCNWENSSVPDGDLVISTGVFTGLGAPGTGLMFWTDTRGNQRDLAEGRFGPYLRYAGFEKLILRGKAQTGCAVIVKDQTVVVVQEASGARETEDYFPSQEGVVLMPEEKGVLESTGFYVAGKEISERLRSMGIHCLAVKGSVGLPVADSGLLLEVCLEMNSKLRSRKQGLDRGERSRVRYLAVASEHNRTKEYAEFVNKDRYLEYGIHFSEMFSEEEKEEYTRKLFKACAVADGR